MSGWVIAAGVVVLLIGIMVLATMVGEPDAEDAAADQARVMETVGVPVATPEPTMPPLRSGRFLGRLGMTVGGLC